MTTLSSIITPTNIVTATSTNTLTNKTIDGANNSISNIDLSTDVTGTLAQTHLANTSLTVNGVEITLGGSNTVTANAQTLTGTSLNSSVVGSSLTSVGTLTVLDVTGNISGAYIIGNGYALSSLEGANVLGEVDFAATANSIAGANVVGEVASATVAESATVADSANSVAGANVSGAVAFATTANSVAGANVSGEVAFAATANGVAGANVTGTVGSATTAGTVTTAAQSNITSVGTLTGLTVSGISNLSAVGNVIITGGTTGQALTTDGAGNLTWTTVGGSSTGNVQFSDTTMFGPVGNGVIDLAFGANKDLLLAVASNIANVEIQTYADGSNNKIWTFTPAGDMFAPGNITASGNVTANGTSTNMTRRGYGMVAANTNVTLDNIRAQIGGSPLRLQISTVSGTMTAAGQSQTMITGSTATASWINVSLSTTPFAMSGAIANNGEAAVLNFADQGAGTGMWRVTGVIANTSSSLYGVTIERLV